MNKIKFNHRKILRITGQVLAYSTASLIVFSALSVLIHVFTYGSRM